MLSSGISAAPYTPCFLSRRVCVPALLHYISGVQASSLSGLREPKGFLNERVLWEETL